jgi:ABC-type lipoprotein release transport system permease subunit
VPAFVSVPLLLVSVAFVASVLPAYFATKVDPLEMSRNSSEINSISLSPSLSR